jgi:hypothetical protein
MHQVQDGARPLSKKFILLKSLSYAKNERKRLRIEGENPVFKLLEWDTKYAINTINAKELEGPIVMTIAVSPLILRLCMG